MVILGIDPGLASTGIGVIKVGEDGRARALDWRHTLTGASQEMPARLQRIHQLVHDAITEFRPVLLGIEDIFFARNVRSAVAMAHGRGAALVAAANAGIVVRSYAPREIKLAIAGSGRAGKDQLRKLVCIHLGLVTPPQSDHESDALAVALCAAFKERSRERIPSVPPGNQSPAEDPRKALLAMATRRRRRR